MSYEVKPYSNILKYADDFVTIQGTVTNDGIVADADGRKVIPAGTALESASTKTILGSRDDAMACTDYSGSSAECVLFTDADVTDGDVTATFLIQGQVDGAVCPDFKYGSVAALKALGINLVGAYTQDANPILTFVCADHATEGSTQIATVSPTLTAGSSYVVQVGNAVAKPPVGTDLTGDTDWAAYTLADAITATNGVLVTLCEIDADGLVVKCGSSAAVVA